MLDVTIRLDEDEKRAFESYARDNNITLEELFKKTLEEKLEDEHDLKVIEEYEERKRNGTVETRPIQELFDELGL